MKEDTPSARESSIVNNYDNCDSDISRSIDTADAKDLDQLHSNPDSNKGTCIKDETAGSDERNEVKLDDVKIEAKCSTNQNKEGNQTGSDRDKNKTIENNNDTLSEVDSEQTQQSSKSDDQYFDHSKKPHDKEETIHYSASEIDPDDVVRIGNWREQIIATIYGQCIGDAIGLLTEFMSQEQARYVYSSYEELEYDQKYPDGHRCRWECGDWTDDSDQMLLILQSLVDKQGEVDHKDFAERLRDWMFHGFAELGDNGGLGIGSTTLQTLCHPEFLKNPHKVSEDVWVRGKKKLAPNGGVMRTSILGIHDWWDTEEVIKNAETICKTTHHDPRCVTSAICVCAAISYMLQRTPDHYKDGKYDVDQIIGDVIKCARLNLPEDEWEELGFYLKCTNLEELDLSEPHSIGYTYKCLGAGFWALKQENFRDTIEAIVRSGGDADTNGAVAGALLACKLGSWSHIPQTWLNLKHKEWLDKNIHEFLKLLDSRYPAKQMDAKMDDSDKDN